MHAHFLKGKILFLGGKYREAEKKFMIKPVWTKYKQDVIAFYKEVAETELRKGNFASAKKFYSKVVGFKPELRPEVADKFLQLGIQNSNASSNLFALAIFFSPDAGNKIADYYYAKHKKVSGDVSLALLKEANKYSGGKHDNELGVKLLKMANSQKTVGAREAYAKQALNYVDKNTYLDSSVQYYTELLGSPKKILLNEEGWIKADKLQNGNRLHYLSSNDFWEKDQDPQTVFRARNFVKPGKGVKFYRLKGGETTVYFKKKGIPTTVYYWVE